MTVHRGAMPVDALLHWQSRLTLLSAGMPVSADQQIRHLYVRVILLSVSIRMNVSVHLQIRLTLLRSCVPVKVMFKLLAAESVPPQCMYTYTCIHMPAIQTDPPYKWYLVVFLYLNIRVPPISVWCANESDHTCALNCRWGTDRPSTAQSARGHACNCSSHQDAGAAQLSPRKSAVFPKVHGLHH